MPHLKIIAAVLCGGAVFAGGYFIPPTIWTRASAIEAIVAGTSIREVGVGNSRVPCRGPHKKMYIFGYTVSATHPSFTTNASGAVCWDLFNGGWAWRIDEPYGYMNSDRSPSSRGADQEPQGYITSNPK
jgi:hypothetical protein